MNPVALTRKRARIGILSPSIWSGGAERWMLNLVRFCDPLQIEWTLCVLTDPWYDERMLTELSELMPVCRDGVRYEHGSYREQPLIEGLRELSARSEAVLCWGYTYNFNRMVDGKRVRVINVSHNFRIDIGRFVTPWHCLGAVSPECAHGFGELHDRVRVIENGVDLNRCFPIRERAAMRAEWGVSDDELVIGFIGRLSPVKNCLALARAVKGLGERARLVFYGESDPDGTATAEEMMELAGGRILFFEPTDDVGSVLHAIDVFMLPSLSEGFSLSLLEAWAAGRPVVATRVGSLPRLEERHGQLVEPIEPDDPPEVLAAAVRAALAAGPERLARAREMVLRHYHVSRMAAEWTDFLMAVADRREIPARAR